jgi:hypothetical protein
VYFITVDCFTKICGYCRHTQRKEIAKNLLDITEKKVQTSESFQEQLSRKRERDSYVEMQERTSQRYPKFRFYQYCIREMRDLDSEVFTNPLSMDDIEQVYEQWKDEIG